MYTIIIANCEYLKYFLHSNLYLKLIKILKSLITKGIKTQNIFLMINLYEFCGFYALN